MGASGESEILDRGKGLQDPIRTIAIISTSSGKQGIRRGRQFLALRAPSSPPGFVIPCVESAGPEEGPGAHYSAEAEPRCEPASDAVCYRIQHLSVSAYLQLVSSLGQEARS